MITVRPCRRVDTYLRRSIASVKERGTEKEARADWPAVRPPSWKGNVKPPPDAGASSRSSTGRLAAAAAWTNSPNVWPGPARYVGWFVAAGLNHVGRGERQRGLPYPPVTVDEDVPAARVKGTGKLLKHFTASEQALRGLDMVRGREIPPKHYSELIFVNAPDHDVSF